MITLFYIATGVATGLLAGFFGVGGGIIMVPMLVYFFRFTQHQAQGMSLAALLLPTGILGVLAYYRTNPFPLKPPLWIAVGIFFGAYVGASLAQKLSDRSLKMGFGILLVAAGLKLILGK